MSPSRPPEPLRQAIAALEGSPLLDKARPLFEAANEAVPEVARDVLSGRWLGHPLHPVLTDLPIGLWTSSALLDLGGRRAARASTVMVGLGVLTAVPTAAAGLVDVQQLDPTKQRVAAVHAVANAVATGLYAASFVKRVRGRRGAGVLLGLAGMTVASVGGYLGGHLAFGESTGDADQHGDASVGDRSTSDGSFLDGPSLLAPSERTANLPRIVTTSETAE